MISNIKISELIKKLQELQNEHGDVEVLAAYDDFGTGEFIPLEDGGISFDSLDDGKLYIGW